MLIKRDRIIPRHMEEHINDLTSYGKMVAITGARGCGKTTLAQKIAKERGMEFISLDDPATCRQARRNPEGLLKSVERTGTVIDEIEKAPRLGRYLRGYSKNHPKPEKFIMTSSIKQLTRPSIRYESRISRAELSTFSQSEIEGLSSPGGFLTNALEGHLSDDQPHEKSVDLWPRVWRGSYPRAVLAENSKESWQWLKGHENLLINRYMKDSFGIRSHDKFQKFLLYLAENSGHWFRPSTIARELGTKTRTIRHWLFFLREADIIDFFHNESMSKFPSSDPRRGGYKVHFLDSGLLASLCGWSSLDTIIHPENRLALLKSFVHGELRKLMIHLGGFSYLSSCEWNNGTKVEFVFNGGPGLVGIDVKASPSLTSSDFDGLRSLEKMTKDYYSEFHERLISGVVFYPGHEVHCSEDGFYGLPVGKLWAPSQEQSKKLPILKEAAMA